MSTIAPTSARPAPANRRLRGDDGAALVEFALAMPILVWFAVAMMEYGFAWRQENLIESALLNATRTDAQQSKGRFADFEALQSLSSTLSGLKRVTVNKVVIWKANSNTDPTPPSSCTTLNPPNGVSGTCNVYSATQMNTSQPIGFPAGSSTNPTCPAGSWDANWCPTTRTNTEGNGDWVGVYVDVTYTSFTGMIPNRAINMKKSAVYRLEPPFVGG